MRSLPTVVVDEFPVESKPVMFQIVGSKPRFNLSLRCGVSDSSHDVFDALLLAVLPTVKAQLTRPNTPEYATVVRQCLSGFIVLANRPVELTPTATQSGDKSISLAGPIF